MKIVSILLSGLMGLAAAGALQAQEAWLLVSRTGHYELARAADGKLEDVLNVGSLAAYGESAQALAFIHYDPATRAYQLDVLDKASRRVLVTHPLEIRLQAHPAGIVEDLVVSSRYVYFVAIRINSARQVALNNLGGRLDLNQINLADGSVRTFPLPPACHTARLVNYDGVPLVYAWNGYEVLKLDEDRMSLVALLQERDVQDIVESERGGCACKRTPGPGPFADDVAIPGAGVFRLSRMGKLQKVLDARLAPVPLPRPSVDLRLDLGRDGQFATLSRGMLAGRSTIGLLGVSSGETIFEYRDASSLAPVWQVRLPPSAAPLGVGNLAAVPDGILFVDRSTGTLDRAAPNGLQALWDLRQLDPTADAASTRVILVHQAPAGS